MTDFNNMAELAQTIVYLRPQNLETIAVLDRHDNTIYQHTVALPPRATNESLEGIPDDRASGHLVVPGCDTGNASRETTPGFYSPCSRVFQLKFNSTKKPSPSGFSFGSGSEPESRVTMPYYRNKRKARGFNYFKIHYNFSSGALLITAIDEILVGSVNLQINQSLLLMPDVNIKCGGVFEFTVEFPDLNDCTSEHEQNYFNYAAELGISNAQYMPTPSADDTLIGRKHLSKAVLGNGAFGEVHMAMDIEDGEKFAIKILKNGGEAEMKEVRIMSRLHHVSSSVRLPMCRLTLAKENIIQYHEAFRLPNGNICIVMELAVNDLGTHLKARKRGRSKFYLSLRCIRSVALQALSALDYLHGEGFTHRDLKPENILVTNWDVQNDIPEIKLADFGLAGIRAEDEPEHKTFCGTKGYVAPEMLQAHQKLQELKKQRDKGMKTVSGSGLLRYNQSIDIWALGKILQELVSAYTVNIPGKSLPANKRAALELIRCMMENNPQKRPTAAECLKDLWITTQNPWDGPLAQKRDRSPIQSTSNTPSSTGEPVRKAIRTVHEDSMPVEEGSTTMILNAIKSSTESESQKHLCVPSTPADVSMEDVQPLAELEEITPQNEAVRFTLRLEGNELSVIADGHCLSPSTSLSLADQETSSSMQLVMRRLLAAGYGNNVTAAGNDTDVSIVRRKSSNLCISLRQGRDRSEVLEVEVEDGEWTGSFWNELLQRSFDPGSGAHCPIAAQDTWSSNSVIHTIFDRVLAPLSLDETLLPQQGLNTVAGITRPSFAPTESDSSWNTNSSKGVTYPSNYDDPTAGLLF